MTLLFKLPTLIITGTTLDATESAMSSNASFIKLILLVFLLISTLTCKGQEYLKKLPAVHLQDSTNFKKSPFIDRDKAEKVYKRYDHSKLLPPAYFLDSIYVTKLPLFDMDKIESIFVSKDHAHDEIPDRQGRVYINLKKSDKGVVFLTLEQIADQWAKTKGPFLYMINSEIVKDIKDVKVDSSYILECEILKSKEISYLQKKLSSFTIVNIMTRNKVNVEKKKEIHIRGIKDESL